MPVTGVRGRQILDDSVTRADINVTATGSALITKVLVGAGLVVQSSTGADSGTGDVTLALGNSGVTAGTYGSSTLVPVITVDQYGRITGVSTSSITAGSGTVTSVGLSLPAIFSVSNSPVTTSGTLTAVFINQNANLVFAGPSSGLQTTPTFRALVAADIPNLDAAKITSGTLIVANGGTGAATLTGVIIGNGTSAMTGVAGTAGQLLRRNAGDTAYEFFTPTYLTANQSISISGDASGTGTTAITLTFATVNTNVGTFNNVTVNGKGLVTAASNVAYLTANQSITLSGHITGTGTTSISTTIANGVVTNAMLVNSSFFIGTTSISLGRTSAAQTLSGVSISGAAGTAPVLTASGTLTTQQGDGTVIYTSALTSGQAGLFASSDNANSILTVNRHPGNYYSQFGFSSNGNLYYRNFVNTAINTSQAWQTIWTSTSLTNLNQLTNGPGFITGNQSISLSGDATGSGTTSIAVTLANSGVGAGTYRSVTVDAKGRVTGGTNPTTLAGYGITDALSTSGGTLSGTLIFGNATSPNTHTIQFGDNTGWTLRFMTSVSGTPTARFSFLDTGQLRLNAYTSTSSFSGTSLGVLAFTSDGSIIPIATPGGGSGLTGTGTTNYIPKFTGSTSVGNSQIFDDGTNVGIGIATPDAKLRVAGTFNGTQAIFSNTTGRGLEIRTAITGGTNEAASILNARSSVTSGELVFQTDGTERVRFGSTGDVGIGTASPGYRLDVFTTATSLLQLYQNDGTNNRRLQFTSAATGTNAGITLNATSSVGGDNMIIQTVGVERFRITSTGSIGINTSTVVNFGTNYRALEIKGATNDTGGAIRLSSLDNSLRLDMTTVAGLATIQTASNTPLLFGTNGTERMRIETTGRQIWANYTAIDSFTYSNIQGNIGFTSSGQIITTPTSFFHIPFSTANVTLSSMASGLQFFANNAGYISRADLNRYKRVRLHVNKRGTAGATGSKLILRYRRATDGFSTTTTDYLDIGTSEVSCAITGTNTFVSTGWITLATNAQEDVWIALMQSGGNGTASPVIGNVYAEFDYRI